MLTGMIRNDIDKRWEKFWTEGIPKLGSEIVMSVGAVFSRNEIATSQHMEARIMCGLLTIDKLCHN